MIFELLNYFKKIIRFNKRIVYVQKNSKNDFLRSIIVDNEKSDFPDFLFNSIDLIRDLHYKCDAYFEYIGGQLKLSIKGLYLVIDSYEELYILHEIFVKGVYNIKIDQEFFLIDVGMNVGIASLYFCLDPNCKKIIAYEPFNNTLMKAHINFGLNEFSSKISIKNFGLGFPSRTLKVDYSSKYKGSVGLNGIAPYIKEPLKTELADLVICDVYYSLKKELIDNSCNYIMKIDCEGAEYEIIERMDSTGILNKVDVYLVEWHLYGPNKIRTIFLKNGYKIISFDDLSKETGLLYAFK